MTGRIGHPNSVNGSVIVTGSDTADSIGTHIPRTHEHAKGRLVVDSPPYVNSVCTAMRKDGTPCVTKIQPQQVDGGLCLPHLKVARALKDAENAT